MVRKCLNGTAADNADLGMTAREGVCGDEHMAGNRVDRDLTADVHLREKGIHIRVHMTEERNMMDVANKGLREIRSSSAQTRNGSWTNTWPTRRASHIATYTNSICWVIFHRHELLGTIIVHGDVLTAFYQQVFKISIVPRQAGLYIAPIGPVWYGYRKQYILIKLSTHLDHFVLWWYWQATRTSRRNHWKQCSRWQLNMELWPKTFFPDAARHPCIMLL